MKKHIVVIGGGHGTSALTYHLKNFRNIIVTAILAVTDMGGKSEPIRQDYQVVALGDMRTALQSMIPNRYWQLARAMDYRIQSLDGKGFLDGLTLGHVDLLSSIKVCGGDIVQGIQLVRQKYRIKHAVLPITADKVHLDAWMDNGDIIEREGVIDQRLKKCPDDKRKIIAVYLRPLANLLRLAKLEIFSADTIVVPAGSPFTSIGACFCVQGVCEAIRQNTRAKLVQVTNLMTDLNEGPGWKASQYAQNVVDATFRPFDYVVCNDPKLITKPVLEAYKKEGAHPVEIDEERLRCFAKEIIKGDYADETHSPIRHNAKLAKLIASL